MPHANSGAGRVMKHDAHEPDGALVEIKTAQKTHLLDAEYLDALWSRAVAQGHDGAVLLVEFASGLKVRATIEKGWL